MCTPLLLAALFLSAGAAPASAVQAVNDECCTALPIGVGVTPGNTLDATDSPITGDCAALGASLGADVWYAFDAPADGLLRASFVNDGGFATFDTVLAAFSGDCLAPVQVACNDDLSFPVFVLQSEIAFEVVGGATYFLEVGGWDGAIGTFGLALDFTPGSPPVNDECDGALAVGEGVTLASNHFATQSPQAPPCGLGGVPAGADVWFRYVATATGLCSASLVDGGGFATFDTVLSLSGGSCAALDPLGCNDDFGFSLGSKVQAFVEEGQELLVAVGGYGGEKGDFALSMTTLAGSAPANDECTGALPVGTGLHPGTTVFASGSPVTGSCASFEGYVDQDVWFTFTANQDGLFSAATAPSAGGNADFDTVLSVFGGSCEGLVELGCSDDAEFLQSLVTLPVSGGETYLIELGGWSGDSGSYVLAVAFTPDIPSPDVVLSQQKISDTQGGFEGDLSGGSASFGISVASLGDLDGDGVADLAVGSPFENLAQPDAGAVWILFLHADGTVKSHARIATGQGGFTGATGHTEWGVAVAALGDLSGDGTLELAVGASGDDDGGENRGAAWILSLLPDGSVTGHVKISDTQGGFGGNVFDGDAMGSSLCAPGDIDGDGTPELAAGAPGRDDSDPNAGAAWIWFLLPDGSVHDWQRISDTGGFFLGVLDEEDAFGSGLAAPGDLDGDGLPDLLVGAIGDDDGGPQRGAIWALFLLPDGKVRDESKISATSGGFSGLLFDNALLGKGLAAAGDLDDDGVADLFAGATGDPDGGPLHGAVWILFLTPQGTVEGQVKLSQKKGGFEGLLGDSAFFGEALAAPGDLDGDGRADLVVGNRFDDDGATDRGALWMLFLDAANPWIQLADALPGSTGPPLLAGSGPLLGDTKAVVNLSSARPLAPAVLVVGLQALEVSLLGGTLVPAADVVVAGLLTSAAGTLQVAGRWPVGVPPGFETFYQAWIFDSAAPQGWAASNALQAVTH